MTLGGNRPTVVIDTAKCSIPPSESQSGWAARHMVVQAHPGPADQGEPDEAGSLQQIWNRLHVLESRLDRVLATADESAGLVRRLKGQEQRLASIEARLTLVESAARGSAGLEGRVDGLGERLADVTRVHYRIEDVEDKVERADDNLNHIGKQLAKWHELHSSTVEHGALIATLLDQNRQLIERVARLEGAGARTDPGTARSSVEPADEWAGAESAIDSGSTNIAPRALLNERSAAMAPQAIIRAIRQELAFPGSQ